MKKYLLLGLFILVLIGVGLAADLSAVKPEDIFTSVEDLEVDIGHACMVIPYKSPDVFMIGREDLYMKQFKALGEPIERFEYFIWSEQPCEKTRWISVEREYPYNLKNETCKLLGMNDSKKIGYCTYMASVRETYMDTCWDWIRWNGWLSSKGETRRMKICGYWNPHLGPQAIDVIPCTRLDKEYCDYTKEWWNTSFSYRSNITVTSSVASTLQDFVINITSDTATLIAAGKMQGDCGDARFTNETSELYYEMENGTCDSANTVFWVRIPYLYGNTDTNISMYYGSAAAPNKDHDFTEETWNGAVDYRYVNHFSRVTVTDSTKNLHNETSRTGTIPSVAGIFGKAYDFDTATDRVKFDDDQLSLNGEFTVEFWINPDTWADDNHRIILTHNLRNTGTDHDYNWQITKYATNYWNFAWSVAAGWHDCISTQSSDTGSWDYIVYVVRESDDLYELYINGVLAQNKTSCGFGSYPLQVDAEAGSYVEHGANTALDAQHDEVRISDGAISSDRIAATYSNTSYAWLSEEGEGEAPSITLTTPTNTTYAPNHFNYSNQSLTFNIINTSLLDKIVYTFDEFVTNTTITGNTTILLPEGFTQFKIFVNDTNGASGQDAVNLSVDYNASELFITWNDTQPFEVGVQVETYANYSFLNGTPIAGATVNWWNTTHNTTPTGFKDGHYYWEHTCIDIGNLDNREAYANKTSHVSRSNTSIPTIVCQDTTPPVVAIQSPTNTIYYGNVTDFNWTAIDLLLDDVWYKLNNDANVTITTNTTITGTGFFELVMCANDTTGNYACDSVNFTLLWGGLIISCVDASDGTPMTFNFDVANATENKTYSSVSGNLSYHSSEIPNGDVNVSLWASGFGYTYWNGTITNSTSLTVYGSLINESIGLFTVNLPLNYSNLTTTLMSVNITSPGHRTGLLDLSYAIDSGSYTSLCNDCHGYSGTITITSGWHNFTFRGTTSYYDTRTSEMIWVNVTLGNVTQCDGTGNNVFLAFYISNEDNISQAINSTVEMTLDMTTGNITDSIGFSLSGDSEYFICAEYDQSYVTTATIQYSADGYSTRNWFLLNANLTNTTTSINMYLVNDTLDQLFSIKVMDTLQQGVPDVYVSIQKYYLDTNTYRTVSMMKSDYLGNGLVPMIPYTTWYQFILQQNNSIVETYSPKQLNNDDINDGISLYISPQTYGEYWSYYDKIAYNCTWTNATTTLRCTVTDTSGLMVRACLEVYEWTALDMILYNRTCDTGSSVILLSNLNNTDGRKYSYTLYMGTTENPNTHVLYTSILDFGVVAIVLGVMGLLMAAFIIMSTGLLSIWNPVAGIVMALVGLIMSYVLGLFVIELTFLAGIVMVGGILVYKMKT